MADASHELRTPLAILKTELELARRSGRSVEELEAALRSAGEETDRLAQLADDLLVIARSDQGRLRDSDRAGRGPRPARGGPAALRPASGRRGRRSARGRPHGGRGGGGPVPARAGTRQPRGQRAAPRRRPRGAASGATGPAGIELAVRDHGPGFPPEFAGQAFERFTRADTGRSSGGAGLGLAIVEAIATAHGGSASVRNLDGGGAEVAIGLTGLSSDGGTPGRSDQEV